MTTLFVTTAFAKFLAGNYITDDPSVVTNFPNAKLVPTSVINVILDGPNAANVRTIGPQRFVIGDDWMFNITLQDSLGNAVNLSNFTVGGELILPNMPSPIDMTVANGRIIVINPPTGQFSVKIEHAVTQAIKPTVGNSLSRIQIFITDAGGNRSTVGVVPVVAITPSQF